MRYDPVFYTPDGALRPRRALAPQDVPSLWSRARAFFARLAEEMPAALRLRQPLGRRQRRDLLRLLVPVEYLVRTLIAAEAVLVLLMDPLGVRRRLSAPPPAGAAGRPDPAPDRPSTDESVGAAIRPGPFRIFRRGLPDGAIVPPPWRPRVRLLEEAVAEPPPPPPSPPPPAAPRPRPDPHAASLALLRRIAALQRALDNPAPLIRRLARKLIPQPRRALAIAPRARENPDLWLHGRDETWNARRIVIDALFPLERTALIRRAYDDTG